MATANASAVAQLLSSWLMEVDDKGANTSMLDYLFKTRSSALVDRTAVPGCIVTFKDLPRAFEREDAIEALANNDATSIDVEVLSGLPLDHESMTARERLSVQSYAQDPLSLVVVLQYSVGELKQRIVRIVDLRRLIAGCIGGIAMAPTLEPPPLAEPLPKDEAKEKADSGHDSALRQVFELEEMLHAEAGDDSEELAKFEEKLTEMWVAFKMPAAALPLPPHAGDGGDGDTARSKAVRRLFMVKNLVLGALLSGSLAVALCRQKGVQDATFRKQVEAFGTAMSDMVALVRERMQRLHVNKIAHSACQDPMLCSSRAGRFASRMSILTFDAMLSLAKEQITASTPTHQRLRQAALACGVTAAGSDTVTPPHEPTKFVAAVHNALVGGIPKSVLEPPDGEQVSGSDFAVARLFDGKDLVLSLVLLTPPGSQVAEILLVSGDCIGTQPDDEDDVKQDQKSLAVHAVRAVASTISQWCCFHGRSSARAWCADSEQAKPHIVKWLVDTLKLTQDENIGDDDERKGWTTLSRHLVVRGTPKE